LLESTVKEILIVRVENSVIKEYLITAADEKISPTTPQRSIAYKIAFSGSGRGNKAN